MIAHRGASLVRPENTVAAFREARRLGVTWWSSMLAAPPMAPSLCAMTPTSLVAAPLLPICRPT